VLQIKLQMPRQCDGKDCLFAARIVAANLNRRSHPSTARIVSMQVFSIAFSSGKQPLNAYIFFLGIIVMRIFC